MNESIAGDNTSKSWVNVLSSILAGWNIFLILLFLLIILASVIISGFGNSIKFGSVEFYIEVAIASAVSIFASYYLAKKIYILLSKLNSAYQYIALTVLVVITILFFPNTFNFNI